MHFWPVLLVIGLLLFFNGVWLNFKDRGKSVFLYKLHLSEAALVSGAVTCAAGVWLLMGTM
jgi:hypothetical protein